MKTRCIRLGIHCTAVVVLLVLGAPTHPLWADGVVRDGLGAVSTARGGTNLGFADNGVILLDNPAAMVNIAGRGMSELSADFLVTDLHYSDPLNDTDDHFKINALPHISLIRKSEDDQWAYGLGVYAPAGFGARWTQNASPPIGGAQMYRSLGALVKLIPGAAYRVNDRLSVGATLGLGVSHAELAGPFTIQTGPLAGAPTILSVHATGTQLVWSAGLQYQLTECTTIGASYISETRVRMDGEASATVFGLGPPVNSEFNSDIQLTWPRSVGVGVKHDMGDRHTLAMDLIWFNWSQAFDNVGLTLDNASNAALAPFMPYDDVFALEWRDTLSVRTGYEFWANDNNVFRMGYVYHRNPVPERTLTTYIPAILEHAFSAGWGTMWRGYHVDLAYQYSFGRSRRVGTSDIVGGDFSNSRTEAQAHWAVITLTHTY